MQIHSTSSSAGYAAWSAMRAGQSPRDTEESSAEQAKSLASPNASNSPDADVDEAGAERASENGTQKPAADSQAELSIEDLRVVQQLRQRDQEVRAHELAHVSAGGQYVTSSPSYEYETGPDGQRYAVGGEVGIDASAISGDPEATLAKAQAVMRAATAPAEPSAQDQRVAAAAKAMASEAITELAAMESEASVGSERGAAVARASEAAEGAEGAESNRQVGGENGGQSSGTETRDERSVSLQTRLEQRIAGFFAGPESAFQVQA